MMAKKSKRAISEQVKGPPIPTQNIKRKKIGTHLSNRKRTRSFKNLTITKPFPSGQTEQTLWETEDFLNNVFASIQDGISILDMDMNIIGVNQTMERWYSHAMPLVGKKCYEAYHGRKQRCDVCPTHQTILSGKGAYEVVPKVGPDGRIVGWLDLYSFPLIDTVTGKMKGIIEHVRDATERERIEEALRQSEKATEHLAQENAIMAEIGRIISSTLNIDEVYERFAGAFRKILPFDRVVVTVVNPDRNSVTLAYLFGVEVGSRQVGSAVPLDSGVIEKIIVQRSSILIQTQDESEVAESYPSFLEVFRAGLRSLMAVPMISKDQVIAILHIHSLKANAYTELNVRLAERVSAQIAGAIANAQLFAKRKQAEEALRKSEERYRTLLENIEEGYFEDDLVGNFTFVNDVLCRNLGYTREELIGMNYRQYTDEKNAAKLREIYNELYKTGKPIKAFDLEAIKKDGTEAIYESSVTLMRDSEGKPIGFRGISRDTTERKRMEEQLRQSEERFRSLVETMGIGLSAIDPNGVITYVNDQMCRMLGYSKEEFIGRPSTDFNDEVSRKRQEEILAKRRKGVKDPTPYEITWVTKDGRKVDTILTPTPAFSASGEFTSSFAMFTDITERKRAEQALQESEETAKRLAQENAIMAEIGQIISSTLNIEEVYEGFAEKARELIPFDRIMINLTDLKNNTINTAYITGVDVPGQRAGNITDMTGTVTKEVIHTRSNLLIQGDNIDKAASRFPRLLPTFQAGLRSMIFVPLISKDQGIGVLSLRSTKPNAYTETDVKLVERIGNQIAGAIANAQLFIERKLAEEALREREEQYGTLLETMEEGYFQVDLAGNLTFVNDSFCKMHAFPKEKLLGMNNREYMSEETARRVYEIFNGVYKTGQPVRSVEWEIIKGDGQKAIMEASVYMIKNAQGERIGFRGIERDITERIRTEEAIRESEKRYRQVIQNAVDIIYTTDANGNFTYANPAALTTTGYSLEELQRFNYRDLILPEHRDRVSKILISQFREKQATTYLEFPFFNKSGAVLWFGQNASLVIEREKRVGFHVIARDITERKKAEEALRRSEEKYRTILETMQEAYYELDLKGNFTLVNDAECRNLGYSREELIGMNNRKYQSEEEVKKSYQIFNKIYRTGEPVKGYAFEITKGDGTKAFHEVSVSLIRDAQGKPIGFRGVSRDITERKQAEEILRRSEEKYRTILETMHEAYYELDLKGNFTLVNDKVVRDLGYTKEELIGTKSKHYQDETTAKKLLPLFENLYRTGEPIKATEAVYISKDGTRGTYELSASLIRDAQGKPIGFRGVSRDITERKQAEEALQQSEEKYRNILENIEDGYYEVDLSGNFTFLNDSMCRIWGYSREELMGLNYKQYTDEETAKKLLQIFSEMYRTGNPCKEYSYELFRKDGAKRYIEASASLKRDSSGKPIGFRGVIRDVTERKKSEEKFANLVTHAPIGLSTLNNAGTYEYVNPKFTEIFGYTLEDIPTGKIWYEKAHPDPEYRRMVIDTWKADLGPARADNPLARVFTVTCKDGSTKEILFKHVSLTDESHLVAYEDITDLKKAEEEKLSLQEQLRQSQKMEAIGQLAGGVAHDFNNLLTVIKGYSQISLFDLKEDSPLRTNIQEIEKATQRATDLTRQLLAFSRRQILNPIVLDLNVLLKDLEKMLRRVIGEDVELVALLSEDLGKVKVDRGQVEQVILNLAVNARDAMPSGGKLTIETANVELDEEYAQAHVSVIPGRYVRLTVSDTGEGMTQEVKERIFEPFFTTKEKGKGTGLGLSMVYGIVKQSSGNIWVYSEPGRGTTFRIYFPRTEGEVDTLRTREETDFFPRGTETVLLAEDEDLVRDLATRLLEQQGYRVLKAANGQEALLVAKEHVGETIHLLLADIVMPQMGGKELADWLKISRPNVKVLFTSGYADNAIVHHGVLDPGTHFLQKPFSLKTLSHKVREVLDG